MEYIGIGIVIAVAIAAGIIIYTKFTKCEDIPSGDLASAPSTVTSGKDEIAEIHQENELIIQMEMLPVKAIDDETKLVEITDSKVLAHVNNLVLGLAQAGNAVNNVAQVVRAANGEALYREVGLASIAKMECNENVTTQVLLRICEALDCNIEDIMERVSVREANKYKN